MLNFRGVWENFVHEKFSRTKNKLSSDWFHRTLSGFFANSDEIRKCGAKKGLRRHLHARWHVYISSYIYIEIFDITYNSKMGNGYTDIVVHT